MKKVAATAAKFPGLLAFSVLVGALAGCGGGYGGGSGNTPLTLSLTANPVTITLGQSATLTWLSSQATSCTASGAWDGMEPAVGMAAVTPVVTGTVTYTLTCLHAGYNGTSTKSVALTVEPASVYTATSLVEDFEGGAAVATDEHLVNPWGIAFGPTTIIGVANNHGEAMTLHDGNGQLSLLMAQFGSGAGAAPFEPTGIVFNNSGNFPVTGVDANHTGPAIFIFAGEAGMIAGWSPVVDPSPVTTYTASDGAVYKGLALANTDNGNFLYATDFANGKLDVFNATFTRQVPTTTRFAFDDPALPDGYAPFGIQSIKGNGDGITRIYVSYAKRDEAEPDDDATGAGLGIISVFDTNGQLLEHLVPEGDRLNAPCGMTLAPADFGTLSNALLVGNFGDGRINGYDPSTGRYLGAVTDSAGTPFAVPGLWGIAFGNDAANQPHTTLFFAAGTNNEANGLYGRIDLGEAAPVLGPYPFLIVTAPEGDLHGTVTLAADVGSTLPIAKVQFFVNGSTLIGTATSMPFTLQWDTTTVSNGTATLRAVATEDNGIVNSSPILSVFVANADVATESGAQNN